MYITDFYACMLYTVKLKKSINIGLKVFIFFINLKMVLRVQNDVFSIQYRFITNVSKF